MCLQVTMALTKTLGSLVPMVEAWIRNLTSSTAHRMEKHPQNTEIPFFFQGSGQADSFRGSFNLLDDHSDSISSTPTHPQRYMLYSSTLYMSIWYIV